MNNDYKIRLQAMIDESSLADVQKKLAKERLKIGADIVLDQFGKNKAEIEKQSKALSKMIKGTLGDAVPDKLAVQWAKQFYKEIESGAKKAAGEQEKLNDNAADKSLSQVFNKFKNSKIGTDSINELWNQLKKIPEEVYKIDTAMTKLYRVTDETDWKYSQFLDQAASKAQGVGRSISGLIDQTAAWAGLGFSLDEADKLAEISSVYANIGNVDDQTAISELAAAMKAFNIEASDSITIVDQLNALGSEYSISAADLGDGLRKSADAMALANNDIEQTLAMIAGGAEITKDAGGMGNSLKVLALRLRGMKGELEAFGEDASDVLPVDKLQSRILEYTKGTVNLFDDFDPSKFKSTYDILLSISKVWNDISATDQAELLDVIAGKHDAGNVSALLKAFQNGQVQQAYGDALNSDGYAMQEQARWLDSLEAKTQQLEAAFQSLSNTVLGSDVLKVLADGGVALLNILDKLVDGFGLLPTLVSGGAITAFIKNFDQLKRLGNFSNAIKSIKEQPNNFDNVSKAVKKLATEQTVTALTSSSLSDLQKKQILINKGLSREQAKTALSTAEFSAAQQNTTFSTLGLNTAAKGLWATMKAHPIMSITAVVGLAISAYSKWKQIQEENRQAAEDSAKNYAENIKSIETYAKTYNELHTALLNAHGDEEKVYHIKKQLLDLQTELNEKYGDEYGKLNLVTDAYHDQANAIYNLNKKLANNFLNTTPGLDTAEQEMKKERTYYLGSTGSLSNRSGREIHRAIQKYEDHGIELTPFHSKDVKGYTFKFVGDASQAKKVISDLESEIRELQKSYSDDNFISGILNYSTNALIENNKILEGYENQYSQMLISQIALSDDLSGTYSRALQAAQNYNDAILNSTNPFDDKKVYAALSELQDIENEIKNNEATWGKYSSVIDTVFDQTDTRLIEFAQKVKKNEWSIGEIAGYVKDENHTDLEWQALADSNQAGYAFDALAVRAEYYGITINELISLLTRLNIVQSELTDNIPELNVIKNKEEMISSINQLSEGFESLDRIMSSIGGSDPFDFSLLTDSKFKDTFGDLGDSYTDFIDTISNSPKDVNACQSAFDSLLTSWLNSTDIIEGLSDNTKQLTIDMLSSMGVANAEEIVTEALVQKQIKLAAQKYDTEVASSALEGATLNEINRILDEAEAAGISRAYLAQLQLEKIAVNDTKIDTTSDIDQIITLANAAGSSTKVLAKLARAKSVLNQYENGTLDLNVPGNNLLLSEAEYTLDQIENGSFDYEFQIDINKIKSGIYGNNTTSLSNTGSSKSPQSTELDLAAESVNNLKQHLDLLTTDLENTDPYSEKLPILKELIQTQEAYNNALQSQADLYYDEYQKSLQSLPQDLQEKISGYDSFSIETIPETLKDAVSKAQSYRDKWNSATISIKQAGKELENLRLKQMDLAQARLDDKIGVVQNKAADIQNQMDEAEAMGLNATSKQYKSLIRLSRQEEKYNQNKLTGLQAELLLLDEDEDAYYDCLGAIQDCENAISKCAQNQAAYNKAILELPIQYLEKANDSLNDELDELQDKQDDLDSAIAGVTGHLQDQIEAQQTLRDEAEETAKKQIDAIQSEIDGLQKANDERKQQLDLEEKLYNLERAKNQKTTRIFRESEGGFVYEADSEAVRNAQSEYEDALFEQTISDMEDKIRDIEESRDALLESYDLEIDRLQKIVESWDGITEAIQRAKDMTMAGTILGSGWQDRVTSGDTGDLENVSGQYEKNDREQTWTERQIEENERLIRQVEDYIEAWQMGQITIREAREEINDIVSDVMPEIEANDERVSSLSNYTSAWSNAQVNVADSVAATTAAAANNVDELLATDARRQAVFDYAAEWSNSALAVGGALGSINEANAAAVLTEGTYLGQRLLNLGAFQETYRSMASSISTMCNSIVDSCQEAEEAMRELSNAEDRYGYGQGTTHARPGLHRVAEGNRPEIIIRNSGAAFLAKRETHYPFAGGETVLNPSDTRHVLRGDHLEQIDDGLPVLKDQQTRSLIDTLGQNAPLSISGMPEAFSPSAGLTAGNVRQENVVVNFGDVNLPQVRDVDTFTRAIADGTLKSALQQRLMRNK